MSATTRATLVRRGMRLEYLTLVWNALEGTVAIGAGIIAHSVALTAFGLDSSLEVFVSMVTIWQLRGSTGARDRRALRLIGACFLVVAAYVGIQASLNLLLRHHPGMSSVGVALTAAAVVAMLLLGTAKLRVGRRLDNPVLTAEARFSLVDAGLSSTVLVGLVLNLAFGLWWADATAALVLAAFALKEGLGGVRRAA
jgi:divalent metal cation (Fe/Co/Zn/Cd) transporter